MSDPGSAAIRRDGTFRARLPTANSASRLTMTGRFLAHGLARGALHYQGGRPFKGCNAEGVWTVHVRPPPPPVQPFVGTTDQGTQVTFERTIESTPHLTRFTFGSLQTNCGPSQVATGTELAPPFDVQFAIPVHQNSFSGDYFDEAFDIKITGSLVPAIPPAAQSTTRTAAAATPARCTGLRTQRQARQANPASALCSRFRRSGV